MTVIPRAFVKVGSLVKVLRGLAGKTRPGRGWSVSELGGDQWLSRGPRYFFAGQARRAGGGVTMEPFWIRVFGGTGFTVRPFEGLVEVPVPGVVFVRVVWDIAWGPDANNPAELAGVSAIRSVEVVGATAPPPGVQSAVDYDVVGVPPNEEVVIVSAQPVAVGVVVLATLDERGVVTHVIPAGGASVGDAVVDVIQPPSLIFRVGVPE